MRMRSVIQRVSRACVRVKGKIVGEISRGVLIYLGVEKGDTLRELEFTAEKIINLRIFPDDNNSMNLSLLDIKGEILSISQFTLTSRIKKGRRPSFSNAMEPDQAEEFYNKFNNLLTEYGIKVKTGEFGEMMKVDYINDGPVTFIIEKRFNE